MACHAVSNNYSKRHTILDWDWYKIIVVIIVSDYWKIFRCSNYSYTYWVDPIHKIVCSIIETKVSGFNNEERRCSNSITWESSLPCCIKRKQEANPLEEQEAFGVVRLEKRSGPWRAPLEKYSWGLSRNMSGVWSIIKPVTRVLGPFQGLHSGDTGNAAPLCFILPPLESLKGIGYSSVIKI